MKTIFIIFLIITFFLGMYVYIFTPEVFILKNNIKNNPVPTCPKLLLRKGNDILLYANAEDIQTGSPPIQTFNDLNEYKDYLETQHKKGFHCPILYLQQENNTQGKDVYKIRPSPFEQNDGVSTNPNGFFSFNQNIEIEVEEGFATTTATTGNVSIMGNTSLVSGNNIVSSNNFDLFPEPVYSASTTYSASTPNYSPDIYSLNDDYLPSPLDTTPQTNPSSQSASDPPKPTPPTSAVVNSASSIVQIKDASREDGNYNAGQYAGFDPTDQYVGINTNIDQIHNSTSTSNSVSDNPMDNNWGGVVFTQKAVDTGKYDDNNVFKPNYYTPKNGGYNIYNNTQPS